jgi:hypothetical protein
MGMGMPPLTVVLRDSDLEDTIESSVLKMKDAFPTDYVHIDVFDMPDGGIVEATAEAMRRGNPERENNMSTLFHWTVQNFRLQQGDKPLLLAPKPGAPDYPWPLTKDEIVAVYEQVVKHPAFNDHIIVIGVSEDEKHAIHIKLGGDIEIEEM